MSDLNRIRRLAGLQESAPASPTTLVGFIEDRLADLFPNDMNAQRLIGSIAKHLSQNPQIPGDLMSKAVVEMVRRYRTSKAGQVQVMKLAAALNAGKRIDPQALTAFLAPKAPVSATPAPATPAEPETVATVTRRVS